MVQEREINLSSILRVMWERGKKILVFTLLVMFVGAIISFLIRSRYEAQVTMFVNVSKIGTHLIGKNNEAIVNTYWQMIPGKKALMDMIKEFDLDKAPYKLKHYRDLEKRIRVKEVDQDLPLFTIRVVLEDATMAAVIANRIADEAIEITNLIRNEEKSFSISHIENELQEIGHTMNNYRETYLGMINSNLKPLLINDLAINNNLLNTYKNEKANMDMSINQLEATRVKFEEVLSATDFTMFLTTRRSVVEDPLALERLRNRQSRDFQFNQLENFTLFLEELNPAYMSLLMEYQKLMIDLGGLYARRERTVQEIARLEPLVKEQLIRLNSIDIEEILARDNFNLALEIMSGIEKQIGWAGTTVTTERLDVFTIHEAVPDTKKVYPRRTLMVLLMGMIAFILALIYFLFTDLYGLMKTTTRTA